MSQSYRRLLKFTSKPGPNLFPTGGETPHPIGDRMADLYRNFYLWTSSCNQQELGDAVADVQKYHHKVIQLKIDRSKNLLRQITNQESGDHFFAIENTAMTWLANLLEDMAIRRMLIMLKQLKPMQALPQTKRNLAITYAVWYQHIGNPLSTIISNPADNPSF